MDVTVSAAATTTSLSWLGRTFTFSEPVEFGYFPVRGDPYFVHPGGDGPQITLSSPAWDGTGGGVRHGAMIDPDPALASIQGAVWQGYDSRMEGYNAANNVALLPYIQMSPGECLCAAESNLPNQAAKPGGGNGTVILEMALLHCLADHPSVPCFAPPYCKVSGTKALVPLSTVNHSLSPNLTRPVGPATPTATLDITGRMVRPLYDVGFHTLSRSQMRPLNAFQGQIYPTNGAMAHVTVNLVHSLYNTATSNTMRERICQAALDYYALLPNCANSFSTGAGYGPVCLTIVLYGGMFMEDEDMLAVGDMTITPDLNGSKKFGEQQQWYYHEDAWDGYLWPKPREEYPLGPPLFGDEKIATGDHHSSRNLAIQETEQEFVYDAYPYATPAIGVFEYELPPLMENAGGYMAAAGRTITGCVLVSRVLGLQEYWKADATFDWVTRWLHDANRMAGYGGVSTPDLHVFGGTVIATSNNYVSNFWYNYAPGRPTLSGQSGAATGSTTATGSVTTDTDDGEVYAVVTLLPTKPFPLMVLIGQNLHGVAQTAHKWSGSTGHITTSGVKTFNATGLLPSTNYYFHFMHFREGAFSAVVTSSMFTTTA